MSALLQIKLPARFVEDCIECDCDIGVYDWRKGVLTASSVSQLAELRDRAEYYVDGVDMAPPGLIRSAKATLAALDRIGA